MTIATATRKPTPGPTVPRKRIPAAERRTRILDAATEVFAERGYVAASMHEISRRAGVVPSVIYDHFTSKRELHIELLEMHGQRLIERSIGDVDAPTPEGLLRAAIDVYFEIVEEDPFAWRFLFRDPPADPDIANAWRLIQDRATEGIAGLIRLVAPEAIDLEGLSVEDASWIFAKGSQSAVNGIAYWWYEHREFSRDLVVEVTLRLIWDGFGRLLEEAQAGA